MRNAVSKMLYRALWLLVPTQKTVSTFRETVHFLVVGNNVYAKLAQTAIESFLFFNPHATVLLHCDSRTLRAVKRSLFLVSLRHPKKIAICLTNSDEVWHKQKLQLILSLSGTPDLFLDADVRINGPMYSLNKVTFLVREGNSSPIFDSGFFQTLVEDDSRRAISFSTKNTTAFSWGGQNLESNQVQLTWLIYHFLARKLSSSPEIRLSEQLTLSIVVDVLELEVSYLKTEDSQFDGSPIESSYFGATSSRFF